MVKSTMIFLVVLSCLYAGGNAATSVPVFFLEFPHQLYLTIDAVAIPEFPQAPGMPALSAKGDLFRPNETSGDPQEPEEPDPQPAPVRPDMEGDLSGKDIDPPPPPP